MINVRKVYLIDAYTQREYQDYLVEEEPLELTLNHEPFSIFMRTPGHDTDLITGFLYTEQIIEEVDDVRIMACSSDPKHRIYALLETGIQAPPSRYERRLSSSCGLCSLTELKQVSLQVRRQRTPTRLVNLKQFINEFQRSLPLYERTGGAHGAALFDHDGRAILIREDIGRHNAVDKVIGAALRARLPLKDMVLLVSSRAGFEIVQKTCVTPIPTLISLGAASATADEIARSFGLQLYSFAREDRAHSHQTT